MKKILLTLVCVSAAFAASDQQKAVPLDFGVQPKGKLFELDKNTSESVLGPAELAKDDMTWGLGPAEPENGWKTASGKGAPKL